MLLIPNLKERSILIYNDYLKGNISKRSLRNRLIIELLLERFSVGRLFL